MESGVDGTKIRVPPKTRGNAMPSCADLHCNSIREALPAGVRVLYTIEGGSSARDVRKYSEFQHEAEVLMPFGSAFTVVTASSPAPGLLLVTLPGQADPMEPEPEPM